MKPGKLKLLLVQIYILFNLFCSTNAFIKERAGALNNSFKLTNSTYGCKLMMQGKEGSGRQVKLRRSHCWRSSWTQLKCNSYSDPTEFVLKKGVQLPVTDPDYSFKTRGMAKYNGDETCVSYAYRMVDTLNRVEAAECRSHCFKSKLSPKVYIYSHSSVGSFHAQYWAFEVVSSSTTRTTISLVSFAIISFLSLIITM